MTVLIVPEAMAPDLRRYVANNGRIYTTHAGPAGAHSLRSFAGLRTTQGGGAVPKIPCHPERPAGVKDLRLRPLHNPHPNPLQNPNLHHPCYQPPPSHQTKPGGNKMIDERGNTLTIPWRK